MISVGSFLKNGARLLAGDKILASGKEFVLDNYSAGVINYYHNEIDSSKFIDVMLVSMVTRGETV